MVPVVSVCIATVDRFEYLREAIASVAAQTLTGIEIVVGDNSADVSYQAALDECVHGYPNVAVRVIHHPKRLRMVDNANFLVDAARGKYWMYLPDDDRLLPTFLAELVEVLEAHPRAGVAFCDHWIIDAHGHRDSAASDVTSARFARAGMQSGLIEHPQLMGAVLRQSLAIQCLLFRADAIRKHRFDPAYEPVLDFDLELRLASDPAIDAYYIASRLVEYRVHGGQTTAAPLDLGTLEAMVGTLERAQVTRTSDELIQGQMVRQYRRSLVVHASSRGDRRRAILHAMRAFRTRLGAAELAMLALAVMPARVVALARSAVSHLSSRRRRRA